MPSHALLLVTCAPRLGWWAECECGWISAGTLLEGQAEKAHEWHVERLNAEVRKVRQDAKRLGLEVVEPQAQGALF